jgi:hypothetical protein
MAEQKNVNGPSGLPQSGPAQSGPTRDYRNSEVKYAILQETNGGENETWINFIKYQGNEEALEHLGKQLSTVEFYILDDLSTFDLETDYLVSELTAKEMSKVDLNHYSFHRKFDGVLKKIDLKLKDKQSNDRKLKNVFKVLGYGRIDEYIDGEDIDPEDLRENCTADSCSDTESESESETETETESESEEEPPKCSKKTGKIPSSGKTKSQKAEEMPRFAKAKAHRK